MGLDREADCKAQDAGQFKPFAQKTPNGDQGEGDDESGWISDLDQQFLADEEQANQEATRYRRRFRSSSHIRNAASKEGCAGEIVHRTLATRNGRAANGVTTWVRGSR